MPVKYKLKQYIRLTLRFAYLRCPLVFVGHPECCLKYKREIGLLQLFFHTFFGLCMFTLQ